jgi:hypothetical protein
MKEIWIMIMKVAIGLANMQRFGQRMHLMNGGNFESMTQKNLLQTIMRMNIL